MTPFKLRSTKPASTALLFFLPEMSFVSNVRCYVRRPLQTTESIQDENRLIDQVIEREMEAYREVTDKLPLALNCLNGGCAIEVYGVLMFQIAPKALSRKNSIDLLLTGIAETHWTSYGFVNYQDSDRFLKFRSVILSQDDAFPEPNVTGYASIPFAFVVRTGQQLPITFSSQSAKISYSLTFKFTSFDILGTNIDQIKFPVHVGPSWPNAPPPEQPQLHSEDDGMRVVLDLEGGVQGNASVHVVAGREAPWIRPRILNNMTTDLSQTAAPAYSEVEDQPQNLPTPTETPPPSLRRPTSSMSVTPFKRSQSEVWQPSISQFSLLRRLNRSLSHESMIIPVDESQPLPYTEQDPLSRVLIRTSSRGNLPSTLRGSSSQVQPSSETSLNRPRFEIARDSPHTEEQESTPFQNIPETREVMQAATPGISSPPPESELTHSATNHPRNLIAFLSQSFKDFKKTQEDASDHQLLPLFRIIVPCTMVGPSSTVGIDIEIESIPTNHICKRLDIILRASVKCKAMGSVRTDLVPLSTENIDFLEEGEGSAIQKHVEFHVPSSEEMGVFGCGFKTSLIELSHQLVFILRTESTIKSKKGIALGTMEFDLGTVSVELMR
ncbi:hypothetical protein BDR26DRAFT_873730 [Obelidium mucronatum]|nr:hypothetical protein BDR26DRAFT_873730 [Obelidium mucronatum]